MLLSGISLYRMVLPVVFAGLAIAAVSFEIYDPWLPRSTEQYADLMDQVRGNPPRSTTVPVGVRWIAAPDGGRFFHFDDYNMAGGVFKDMSMLEMHPDTFVPVRRTFAPKTLWETGRIVFVGGWERDFQGGGMKFAPFTSRQAPFAESRRDFSRDWRNASTMTNSELAGYIEYRRDHGLRTRDLQIELEKKRALPFVPLVMMLIALPFAFAIGRQGKLYGIGIAIVLSVIYWCAVVLSGYLGKLGILPPLLAAWSPNLAFALTGIAAFLALRT